MATSKIKVFGLSFTTLLTFIAAAVIASVFIDLVRTGAMEILKMLGVENFYLQAIIVIVFFIIILLLFGISGRKLFKEVFD